MRATIAVAAVAAFASAASAAALPKRDLATVYEKCQVSPTGEKTVALTFDDGVFAYEDELIPLLAQYNATSTFFLNGKNWACIYDEKSVQTVRNLVAAGHELGSHTWSHPNMAELEWNKLHNDMYKIEDALVKIVGIMPALMRPPFGSTNSRALAAVKDRNQSVVLWDFDSMDGLGKTAVEIKKRYDDLIASAPQSILTLNHSVQKITAKETIPYALEALSKAGYKFVSVSQCLGIEPYQFVQAPAERDATWTCGAATPAPA